MQWRISRVKTVHSGAVYYFNSTPGFPGTFKYIVLGIDRWFNLMKHIHLLQVVVGRKMMTRRQQISSLSNMPLPTIKFVFGWNSQHIHLAMETLACSPILFSNLQDRSWKKNSSVSSVELQRVMLYTILHILRTGFMYGICLPTYTIKINQM